MTNNSAENGKYPKIPELNRAGYRALFSNYSDDWIFEKNYPLSQKELEVVAAFRKQYPDAEVYAVRRVEKPDGTSMSDLVVNGHAVEIKSISSPKSVQNQVYKAKKQGVDGIIFCASSDNEAVRAAITKYTGRYSQKYMIFKKDTSAAEINSTTEVSNTNNLPRLSLIVNNFDSIAGDEELEKFKRMSKKNGSLSVAAGTTPDIPMAKGDGTNEVIYGSTIVSNDAVWRTGSPYVLSRANNVGQSTRLDRQPQFSPRHRTNAYWEKRSLERLTAAEQASKTYMTDIHKVYDEAMKQTVKDIKKLYQAYYKSDSSFDMEALNQIAPSGDLRRFWEQMRALGLSEYLPDNYRARMTRLELLNAQLWSQAKQVGLAQNIIETAAHRQAIEDSYYKTIYDTAKGINYTPAFTELDSRTLNKVLTADFQGKNYSERIWGNTDKLADDLRGVLGKAIALGQPLSKTSRDIRRRFDASKSSADRLIRTETNYFENASELEAYQSMDIDRFKFLATLDSRTSDICREHDGKIFKVKDAIIGDNVPPLHPYCRSTTVAYLGREYEPKERIARNPRTGKNYKVANMSYQAWHNAFVNNIVQITGGTPIVRTKSNKVRTSYNVDYDVDSLSQIDPVCLQDVSSELGELMKQYPELSRWVADNGNLQITASDLGRQTVAATVRNKPAIKLNSRYFKNKAELIKVIEKDVKSGHMMPATNYDNYALTHEFGHLMQNYLLRGKNTDVQTSKMCSAIIAIAMKQSGGNEQFVLRQASKYGSKNSREFFAEAFANMLCGSPNVIGQATKRYLERRSSGS